MDKNKKTIILLFFLMPAAVFVLLPNFKGNTAKVAAVRSLPFMAKTGFDKKKLVELLANDNNVQKIPVNRPWGLRDPFDVSPLKVLPPDPKPEVVPVYNLALTGILWSGAKPSVIINDRVIGVGEKVEGLTVKEIIEGRVVLMDGDREVVLMMRQ